MSPRLPNPVGDVMRRVDGTLSTVDELALVKQVPEIARQVQEIHRIVSSGAPR